MFPKQLMLLIGTALMQMTLAVSSAVHGIAQEPFKIAIEPVKDRVQSGSVVELKVVSTNTSDHDLAISSMYQGSSNASFKIDVRDSSGIRLKKIVRPDDNEGFHSLDLRPPVKPGASVRDLVSVSAFYDLSAPGEYMIQLSRQLDDNGPEVKSNTVTVTVLPATKSTSQQF